MMVDFELKFDTIGCYYELRQPHKSELFYIEIKKIGE